MVAGVRRLIGPVLALAAAMFALPAPSQVATAPQSPRIVAIGDLHGDFEAWRAIAAAARLVDAKGRWIGGNAIVVQTGDVPDRGADTVMIVRDLMRLQREAKAAGGRVVALVGNHEAMNITGDLRYVSSGEYAAFADALSNRRRDQTYKANRPKIEAHYRKADPLLEDEDIRQRWLQATPRGMLEHQAAWHPNGEIGSWVIGNPAVVVIDGTLFVHAGISAAYAGRSPDDINRAVAAALAARDSADDAIINDPLGPLWYRGLARGAAAAQNSARGAAAAQNSARGAGAAQNPARGAAAAENPARGAAAAQSDPQGGAPPGQASEYELASVLAATGARRMVIAHTPNPSGILILHGGRLARIDTGISSAYGGQPSYLEIIDGVMVPHLVPRPSPAKPAK